MLQGSEVVIAGRVMGTVIGTRKIEVTATGKVAGTLATRDLITHDASLIDGQINILNPDNTISTTSTGPNRATSPNAASARLGETAACRTPAHTNPNDEPGSGPPAASGANDPPARAAPAPSTASLAT